MLRSALPLAALLIPALGAAQFAHPKREYHLAEPGLYLEDPFIVKYRREFFAVFRGDFQRFERAYAEIQEMALKDPRDARALVWLGNGHTVKAGLILQEGKREESLKLLAESRTVLDRAVSLAPEDPNIYMMRAATLFVQGQFFPLEDLPPAVWERLRDDCLKFIDFLGEKMTRTSVHVRGETYGELGIAYLRLGDREKAAEALRKVIELCPGTTYEERAKKELAKL